jgi:hypothetical protein
LKVATRQLEKLRQQEQHLLRRMRDAEDQIASRVESELKQVIQEQAEAGIRVEAINGQINQEACGKLQLMSVYELSEQVRSHLCLI